MKIVEQSVEVLEGFDGNATLWRIEEAARNCYKSEGKNSERDIAKRDALIRAAVKRGHTSVLEHGVVSFRVICNRGVSHEWVRHRIGWSYSQESTRYCNYGHAEGITVIWPWFLGDLSYFLEQYERDGTLSTDGIVEADINQKQYLWLQAIEEAEAGYLALLREGCKLEEARGVLPNDLKTEIVCTANVVALRHFFKLRCAKASHPQIRELALQLLAKLNERIPIVFEDLALDFLKE